MPSNSLNPRDYPAAKITRMTEPYHYQRARQLFNKQPRPAQPNTNQPNQKAAPMGWGMSTSEYWGNVLKKYQKRHSSQSERK